MRASIDWAPATCSFSQQWCRLPLSFPFYKRGHWCSKRVRLGGRAGITPQSARCDLGTKENTYLIPLATSEFNFLFTWCPKLLLFLPQPHHSFFSVFFAFHLSPLWPLSLDLTPTSLVFCYPLLLKSIPGVSITTFLLAVSNSVASAHTSFMLLIPVLSPNRFRYLIPPAILRLLCKGLFFPRLDFNGLNLLSFYPFLFQDSLVMSSWGFVVFFC